MENKEVATVNFITKNLIICFICYFIIFEFLIGSYISNSIFNLNLFIQVVIYLIYQIISVFLIWKIAFKRVMKNCVIEMEDVNLILRNILIFCFAIFSVYVFITIPNIRKNIDYNVDIISKDMTLEIYQGYLDDVYSLEEYNIKVQNFINNTENKVYFITFLKYICSFVIFMVIGYLQKKELLKRVI